jgi:hypothetical protein
LVSLCSAVAGLAGGLLLEAYGFGPLGVALALVVLAVLPLVARMPAPTVEAASGV